MNEPAVAAAEQLAAELLAGAEGRQGRAERGRAARVSRLLSSPEGLGLILALTDEVLRIHDPRRAAAVLAGLVGPGTESAALGPLDRLALRAGARLGPHLPQVVLPAVRARVRSEMAGVVLPAGRRRLARHVERRRRQGIRLNVNVLGEAILGEDEAGRRLQRVLDVLDHRAVDYVSVKISSVCSQLDVLCFDHEVERIAVRLRRLYRAANSYRPAKFVNLDMEEYRDLELTLAVFRRVLDEPAYARTDAGIVLQAYLPDSLPALEELCAWARARRDRTGAWVKVRLVKGANLAMEHVDAELHGWPAAPFLTKDETDANYKRMLDVVLDRSHDGAVRVGVASHNLFEVAWAVTQASIRGASDRIEIEMLEGMAPAVASAVAARTGGLLLYAPIVERGDIESAIAYLVRRLDENSRPDNFLAHSFSLQVGSPAWEAEAGRFRRSVSARHDPAVPTRRVQNRAGAPGRAAAGPGFGNEPDTDFSIAANREWIAGHLDAFRQAGWRQYRPVVAGREVEGAATEMGVDPSAPGEPAYRWCAADSAVVSEAVAAARAAGPEWAATAPAVRRRVLEGAADALARRRGELLAVMAFDAAKTVREGDPEVSEAIDFAVYYAEHVPAAAGFRPHGTVVVASPWNFPLSIPAGGVLGALAAGNAVILKPAPESVAVAGELAAVLWEGGVPRSVLQFVPCVDGAASRLLITHPDVDAVVLTGSWETARRFVDWRPGLRLHAETSGKNAMVITATADLDEAIADLLHSAFGHAGQKCSAASLAIVEAPVHDDPRFLRRLADAVRSLRVGPAWDPVTSMGPLIRPPEGPLLDAFTRLGPGERWLVRPVALDELGYLWSPGVKVGVAPGSPFHLTECFGPVLGVMRAANVDEAIRWQNAPAYGLTAGLHALDPGEIARWLDQVEAGNLYVNRGTTGAIVGRQPFGGWKRSVVGPGAKAGGPNYVASLGTWPASPAGPPAGLAAGWPVAAAAVREVGSFAAACRAAWAGMRVPVDPTGLEAEANSFRYCPLRSVLVCRGAGVTDTALACARVAAAAVGVELEMVDETAVVARVGGAGVAGVVGGVGGVGVAGVVGVDKVRFLGTVGDAARLAALDAGWWVDDTPVAADPRREVLRWVREQAVSESLHRHGNVTGRRRGLPRRRGGGGGGGSDE
jgi:RHH-type proline utilization regulon transcriptional repressor/proline dehydrogenase/delta 1-pyrroline-5-carboxylate dehydrogenase